MARLFVLLAGKAVESPVPLTLTPVTAAIALTPDSDTDATELELAPPTGPVAAGREAIEVKAAPDAGVSLL